ncbi:DUF481 domain-containing protein [Vibrio sp. F74]|uniref:DUF481 domain-containing protein n=1 Tax=Vibrio sp. F74 TaxID=700020 RepID=UPI0036F32A8C
MIVSGLFFSPSTLAEDSLNDNHENSPLKSEIEFGYQSHTGNTDSQALNSRVDAEYTSGRHRHSGEFKLHKLDKNGEEDKFQLTYEAQSDYKLGIGIYLYGGFKGIDSRHSAYYKDYTLSGGLGYQVVNSKDLLVEVEIGPGYRYQEPNLDELDDDDIIFPNIVQEPIFRGQFSSNWQIIDSFSLSAKVTLTTGESNSKVDTELSAINNITDDIALKIVHEKQSHSKVPNGLSDTESSLSVNLLFIF